MAAQEKALLTRIERSKLEIAEVEAELANFLDQRKQLDAEIAQAAGIERSKLQFARDVVVDEIEGSKLLIAESSVALRQAQAELDGIEAKRALLPVVAAKVAGYQRAQAELLASLDELLQGLADAAAQGVRVPIHGLALGGGAAAASQRLDLLPLRALPVLTVDAAGAIHCRHVAVADASQADLIQGAA
jgi:hypothetical protein